MKKIILKISLFLCIFLSIWYIVNSTLKIKNSDINRVTEFYCEKKNTIDVIFYGASHGHTSFLPSVLWEKEGISSFCFSGPMQTAWETYYYMKESLKTQKPKLMVYNVTGLACDDDYGKYQLNNSLGLKTSMNKLEAIKADTNKEDNINYLLGLPMYHSRYSELKKEDFLGYFWNNKEIRKGFNPLSGMEKVKRSDVNGQVKTEKMSEKSEKYFRKIIELSQKENIPLLLVLSPYDVPENYQEVFNKAEQIAKENEIQYLDYNKMIDELNIDYMMDMNDSSHVNLRGAEKLSNHLAEYLHNNYILPDHRGDSKYSSWKENADILNHYMDNFYLINEQYSDDMIRKLKNNNYVTFILSTKGGIKSLDNRLIEKFEEIGLDKEKIDDQNQWCYAAVMNGNDILFEQSSDDKIIKDNINIDGINDININVDKWDIDFNIDDYKFKPKVADNINIGIVVYDKQLDKVIYAVGIDNNGYGYLNKLKLLSDDEKKENLIRKENNKEIIRETNLGEYLSKIDKNYTIAIISANNFIGDLEANEKSELIKLGFSESKLNNNQCYYGAILNNKNIVYEDNGTQSEKISIAKKIDSLDIELNSNEWNINANVNKALYNTDGKCGIFIIYDNENNEVIDVTKFIQLEDSIKGIKLY